jgi:hypothetical protein
MTTGESEVSRMAYSMFSMMVWKNLIERDGDRWKVLVLI